MRTSWTLLLTPLALLVACASAPQKGGNMAGLKERQMAKCPSAVATAKTTVADTDDGVEVSFGGTGEGAEAKIRDLAGEQAEVEVDLDTFETEVKNFWIAGDVGKAINPVPIERMLRN